MIDTLEAVSSTLETEPSPGSVKLLNIWFDGELWKPRYPSLFDYEAAPFGLNLVPSFKVKAEETHSVEVTLMLQQPQDPDQDQDQRFEFPPSDSQIELWKVIQGDARVTPSSVTSTSCVLKIELLTSQVTLRVFCRKKGQEGFNLQEAIEGGLFLSFMKDSRLSIQPVDTGQIAGIVPGRIRITGTDVHKRLQYDLFADTVYTDLSLVSAELEPEPAFRVPQGVLLDPQITLAKTDLIFEREQGTAIGIKVEMHEPSMKPDELVVRFLEDNGPFAAQSCGIQWTSLIDSQRLDYRVTSFSMVIRRMTNEAKKLLALRGGQSFGDQLFGREARDGEFGRKLLELLSMLIAEDPDFLSKIPIVGEADPTIIDTPTCTTINGQTVCMRDFRGPR
jgi:hypothetical protein